MKKVLSVLLAMAIVLGIGVCGMVGAGSAEGVDITAVFTDPVFRNAVYSAIGKTAPEPIYDTDAAKVEMLLVGGVINRAKNLAGVEHFVRLKRLFVSYNQLTELPTLPSSLADLYCDFNQLTSLPALPPGLTYLSCENNQLTSLPALPSDLRHLRCEGNKLTSLPALPDSLWYIYCGSNKLTSLPDLPNNVFFMELDCSDNNLISLPALPNSLLYLDCSLNQLTSIDVTGLKLQDFYCNHNYLPGKSAVTGFNGTWDGADFIFDPQRAPLPQQADKAALTAKIIQAKAIAKGNYTDASWNALQTAINAAQAVANNANATQMQVDTQVTVLEAAIAGLTEKTSNPDPDPTPELNWWETLPFFIQLILRYILFGWLWMN